MSSGSREYKLYPLGPGDDVQLRVRRRVPLERLVSLLLEGHEVFVECDRRMASYIRRRIESRIGELVEAYPSIYRGMEGYVFKVSLVGRVLGGGAQPPES
jgi:hypothetical protein